MSIRYDKKTEAELSRVVRNFNSKISRLEKQNKDLKLPDKITKSSLKATLDSRKELNNTIKSLSRFSKRGAEETYITESGIEMTKWERREIGIKARTSQIKLQKEINKLENNSVSIAGRDIGHTYAQMGNTNIKNLEMQLQSVKIERLEKARGDDLQRFKNRVSRYAKGKTQRQLEMFKQNYFDMLRKNMYSTGNKEIEKLVEKLDTLTAEQFYNLYEFDEAIKEIPLRYRAKNDELYEDINNDYNKELLELMNTNIDEILDTAKVLTTIKRKRKPIK